MTETDAIIEQAAAWFARQSDESMDWAGFTTWLEADPRHRQAFDQLCLLDSDLDLLAATERPLPAAANDQSPRRRWPYWAGGGGAIAAGLALILMLQPGSQVAGVVDYRSAPAQIREIAMADGTKVTLAPASHLVAQGDEVRLEGAAYFDVPHRPDRTLTVRAGGLTIRDIGTQFEVTSYDDAVEVNVAEGQLAVTASGLAQPVRLAAGRGLTAEGGAIRLNAQPQSTVAAWRRGKLVFDNVPVALAVRDVARYSGTRISVDPEIGNQRFSGVISIHDGRTAARDIAQILGADARLVDGGIRLEPRRR